MTSKRKPQTMTAQDIKELLVRMLGEAGSNIALARKLKLSPQYLSDLIHGNRPITARVASPLGYQRVVIFTKIKRETPVLHEALAPAEVKK